MRNKLLIILLCLFAPSCDKGFDPDLIKKVQERDVKLRNDCVNNLPFKSFDVVKIKGLEEKYVIESCTCSYENRHYKSLYGGPFHSADTPYVSQNEIDNPIKPEAICYFVNGGYSHKIKGSYRNSIEPKFLELVK